MSVTRRLTSVCSVVAVLAGLTTSVAHAQPAKVPVATGTGGAVATVDTNATEAGLEVLRAGGNAVDAAVAAAAVLGVTEPFSCGIGGGGFMVIYRADQGKVTTIDHREISPAAMRPDSFWEDDAPLPFAEARYSGMSAGVPGTVAGWASALRKHGTMGLDKVLQPAIRVAHDGFTVDQTFADQTQGNVDFFDDVPSSAELFLDPDGTPKDVGTTFRNPDLARTYERIAHLGTKGFYRGAVASAMVEAVQNPPVSEDANHAWRPGVMTTKDVRAYTSPEREPTRVSYRGLDVYGMAPPSSGGSTTGEALNILGGYDLSEMDRAEALHYYLESARYSFADRNAYLADPEHFDVPLRGLLSPEFAAERRALIGETASNPPVVEPGDPYPHDGGAGAGEASATVTRAGTTTHLTVGDDDGNVVSYTFTIESTGGNGIVVPGFGFLLNNELTDFNYSSLTHPNRVDGDKRPRSSMNPTIVLRNGEPYLAVGSPGGATIITTVLQILVDRLDLGATLPQAVAAPRATQLNTPSTIAEPEFIDSPEAAAMRERGHTFTSTSEIGAATGIEFLDDGRLMAVAEPTRRGGGSAGVVTPG
ncbi:MAG: gamma-glutamyltransferase [Actinophytocola sp.]|nr:gamma-glutamyltransferase [Actinophytocola sp.]